MKILIIEDEPGIKSFLQQGLQEEGFDCLIAETGTIGLQLAQNENPDLILLDWMLPELNGLELCKKFRKENSSTPIIFLTAKDTVEETIAGLQNGANDFIKKPFHFQELLERINVQLRSKQANIISLGKIKINEQSREVFKDEKLIQLTVKEFDLLLFLLKNKNKVCERKEILKAVWDINFEYDSGVIDVYINALRKKMAFTKEENYIQTIRGVGYMAKI
ncbi:response regulator transcription factor [Mesonia maritima]|uniref:DNA-binding response OmpR family regulator n=1 Tax=Mesonia maritima TaxID=1793873 RepID=A0ABU1K7B3_9FLAO|nr:response regulator transcription factor [Mesonia maritima]MDR6301499.1 DNA-binding response OmpR family regulator [Mesonia maritima]